MSVLGKAILMVIPAVFAAWVAWRPAKDHPANPIRIRGIFRLINAAGRACEAFFHRPLVRLDPSPFEEELAAIKRAEHDLYGSPNTQSELAGLRALFNGFDSSGSLLSTVGRMIVLWRFRKKLQHRQQIIKYVENHPEVRSVSIRQPLIIAGLPRTGTSFLERLMATDPRTRAPIVWLMVSDPNPRPPTKEEIENFSDPRLQGVEKGYWKTSIISPDLRDMVIQYHEAEPRDVDEESRLMEDCMWNNTGATYVGEDDSYKQWILDEEQDKSYMYRYVKVWLQIQSSVYPPESHWILKTPAHTFFLPALVKEFPDANLVFTHRNPRSLVASASQLNTVAPMITMDYRKYDPKWHGERILNALKMAADSIVAFHKSGSEAAKRAIHVRYEDLVADPIGTVERIYDHFGYEVTDEFRSNMRHYLETNRQHKHGKPRYSLEQFGLSEEMIDEAFADYNRTFRQSSTVRPQRSAVSS